MAECDVEGCTGQARLRVCAGHQHKADDLVRGLPVYYVRLHTALGPAKVVGEHVSGSKPPQAAMSMSVWSVMEDMVTMASRWARRARNLRGVDPLPNIVRPGLLLVRSVESLQRHHELLLAEDGAAHYLADLSKTTHRADVALKQDKLIHRLDAPCPACDHKSLFRKDGDEWVLCGMCGARWDEQAYRRLVHVLAYEIKIGERHA
jgi:ribosomal protein L37AE/L43A